MKRIILLSTALLLTGVLTACNSTVKPECWKATHNTVGKDCNSGGGFTMNSPRTGNKKKTNVSTDVGTSTPDVPSPDTDEGTNNNNPQAPEDNTNDSNDDNNNPPSNEDNNSNPPNQSNSNDIEGYDPFGGLYGPGT